MAKIIGTNIPNIPWEDKPAGFEYPVWRYSSNPVITRDNLHMANSIFNSAVVPYGSGFAGVFRADIRSRAHKLVVGFSKDAINWELENKYIFNGYDPRLCELDGKYYLSWVNLTPHGTTIGIAYTEDFKSWTQLEDACNARHAQHIALFHGAALHGGKGFGVHGNNAVGSGFPGGDGLCTYVHHHGVAGGIKMCQIIFTHIIFSP